MHFAMQSALRAPRGAWGWPAATEKGASRISAANYWNAGFPGLIEKGKVVDLAIFALTEHELQRAKIHPNYLWVQGVYVIAP